MPGARTVVIALVSYSIAALVAAAIVLLLIGSNRADFASFLIGATLLVLVFALAPFALALYILQAIRRTGWLAHGVAGLLVSLAAQLIMSPAMLLHPGAILDSWQLLVGGGVAGIVYWALFRFISARVATPA